MASSSRISSYLVMITSNWSALLVVALLVHRLVLPAGSASITTHRGRFANPCAGSRSSVMESVEVELKEEEVSSEHLRGTFDRLAHKTDRLRKRVRQLKNLYISKRFKDNKVVNDLDQIGLKLNGMPSTEAATVASIGSAQVVTTVHEAFKDLAKVSVFIDQARMGEVLAENEHVTFEADFGTIEDHHEEGLYLILCSLHRVSQSIKNPITPDMYHEILNFKVTEVDRNALRHTRDYLVLRDFEKILGRLEIHFLALKQLHAS